jgi:hypothetical protein
VATLLSSLARCGETSQKIKPFLLKGFDSENMHFAENSPCIFIDDDKLLPKRQHANLKLRIYGEIVVLRPRA